jgi:hypothetical protein
MTLDSRNVRRIRPAKPNNLGWPGYRYLPNANGDAMVHRAGGGGGG